MEQGILNTIKLVKLKIAFAIFLTLCYLSPPASGLTHGRQRILQSDEPFLIVGASAGFEEKIKRH